MLVSLSAFNPLLTLVELDTLPGLVVGRVVLTVTGALTIVPGRPGLEVVLVALAEGVGLPDSDEDFPGFPAVGRLALALVVPAVPIDWRCAGSVTVTALAVATDPSFVDPAVIVSFVLPGPSCADPAVVVALVVVVGLRWDGPAALVVGSILTSPTVFGVVTGLLSADPALLVALAVITGVRWVDPLVPLVLIALIPAATAPGLRTAGRVVAPGFRSPAVEGADPATVVVSCDAGPPVTDSCGAGPPVTVSCDVGRGVVTLAGQSCIQLVAGTSRPSAVLATTAVLR